MQAECFPDHEGATGKMPTAEDNAASWEPQCPVTRTEQRQVGTDVEGLCRGKDRKLHFLSGWVAVNARTLLPSPSVARGPVETAAVIYRFLFSL